MARSSVIIREIKEKGEWARLYPLLRQTNPQMTRRQFESRLRAMLPKGYRCIGAWQGKKLVGIMGFWVGTRFWCDKYIDMDNVIVDKAHRGGGVGRRMLAWVEAEGRRQKCKLAVLDSYTTFHDAHRFYFRAGYVILGYHFTKPL